jgi:hypothetical protein
MVMVAATAASTSATAVFVTAAAAAAGGRRGRCRRVARLVVVFGGRNQQFRSLHSQQGATGGLAQFSRDGLENLTQFKVKLGIDGGFDVGVVVQQREYLDLQRLDVALGDPREDGGKGGAAERDIVENFLR